MARIRHLFFALLFAPSLLLAQPNQGQTGSLYQQNKIVGLPDTVNAQRARTDAIRNALTATNNNLNQGLSGLSQSILLRPTKEQNDTRYKSINYVPNFQIGTITILPYGSQPTAGFRGTGDVPILDLGLVAGPPGSASGTVGSVNGTAPNTAGNVLLTTDQVPPGTTNAYAISGEYGRSIRRTQANLKGQADASAYIASLVSTPGTVFLTDTLYVNSPSINIPVSKLKIRGDATIVVGPNVQQVFFVDGQDDVSIEGIRFIRADGNTNTPMSLLVKRSTNVSFSGNTCTGVLGLQTWRYTYSQVDSTMLCRNITANNNTITGVNSGLFGGAITFQYLDKATANNNTIDDCVHGILNFGGDANPANGDNNSTNTTPKWAKNISISGNKVTRTTREAGNGGSIWCSMAEAVTISNNQGSISNDYIYGAEGSRNVKFKDNTGSFAASSVEATFYGSDDVTFDNTTIEQGPTDGYGTWIHGTLIATKIRLLGGKSITRNPAKAGVFTDAMVADGMVVDGRIIRSAGNGIETQQLHRFVARNNDIETKGPLGIQNTGGIGGEIADNKVVFTGSDTTGTKGVLNAWASPQFPAQYNAITRNTIIGYGKDIHNDLSGDNSGYNKIQDNTASRIVSPTGPAAKSIIERNRNPLGAIIDGSPDNGQLRFSTYAAMTTAMQNYPRPARVLVVHDEFNGLLQNGQWTRKYYDYDPELGLTPRKL
jgi:hypothetical protein